MFLEMNSDDSEAFGHTSGSSKFWQTSRGMQVSRRTTIETTDGALGAWLSKSADFSNIVHHCSTTLPGQRTFSFLQIVWFCRQAVRTLYQPASAHCRKASSSSIKRAMIRACRTTSKTTLSRQEPRSFWLISALPSPHATYNSARRSQDQPGGPSRAGTFKRTHIPG